MKADTYIYDFAITTFPVKSDFIFRSTDVGHFADPVAFVEFQMNEEPGTRFFMDESRARFSMNIFRLKFALPEFSGRKKIWGRFQKYPYKIYVLDDVFIDDSFYRFFIYRGFERLKIPEISNRDFRDRLRLELDLCGFQ